MSIQRRTKRPRDKGSSSDESSKGRTKRIRNEGTSSRDLLVCESLLNPQFSDPTWRIIVEDTEFEVSQQALKTSTWFSRALYWSLWSQPLAELHGDSVFAMRIVFQILHHNHLELPPKIRREELFQLAAACDKYDLTPYVRPIVRELGWISQHWQDSRPEHQDCESWCWWPVILSTFEAPESIRQKVVMDKIAGSMYCKEGTWLFEIGNATCEVACIDGVNLGQMRIRRLQLWAEFDNGCLEVLKNLHNECNSAPTYWTLAMVYFTDLGLMTSFRSNLGLLSDYTSLRSKLGLCSVRMQPWSFFTTHPAAHVISSVLQKL